jgi:hypothetical protein
MANEYAIISGRIENWVHEFLSSTEKQLRYGQMNSDIFERNRRSVNARLHAVASDALAKPITSVYRQLSEGDEEARRRERISCSCRATRQT